MEYEKDLLDEIVKRGHLDFVSQIRHQLTQHRIKKIMEDIPKDAYTEEQWEEARFYCFGGENKKSWKV